VLDEHHRHAALGDAAEECGERALVVAREARRRLVEQQYRRRGRERARDLDQAPVDVRQVGRAAREVAAVADVGRERSRPRDRLGARRRERRAEAPARLAIVRLSSTDMLPKSCEVWYVRAMPARAIASRAPDRLAPRRIVPASGR
jgi:hypothetical protein